MLTIRIGGTSIHIRVVRLLSFAVILAGVWQYRHDPSFSTLLLLVACYMFLVDLGGSIGWEGT